MLRITPLLGPAITLLAAVPCTGAQLPEANYDEAKVGQYTLPDPLVTAGGQRVQDAKSWRDRRRPEILELYRAEVFGRSPAKPRRLRSQLVSVDWRALGGKAIRRQVTI